MSELNFRKYTNRQEVDKAINTLSGIVKGIASDGMVNEQEIKELNLWCEKHKSLISINPFSEFITTIQTAISDNELTAEEIADIQWLCQKYEAENNSEFYNAVTAELQELQGFCHGILADGEIKDQEVHDLKNWLNKNTHLANYYPYDELYALLTNVLEDGVIDDREKTLMKAHFQDFISLNDDALTEKITTETANVTIKGICAIDPDVRFDGHRFCFTGVSASSGRKEIASKIKDLGGEFVNSVSKKTNYLIVGDNGNPAWTFACYGRKVEKAIGLRKQGLEIVIVHEFDFWDAVEDMED